MRTWWMFMALGCADPEVMVDEELPPVNPNHAVGRTYVLDLLSVSYVQPVGVDALIGSVVAGLGTERAFTVLQAQPGRLLVRFGGVAGGPGARQQDRCALTTDVVLQNGPGDLFGGRKPGPLPGRVAGLDHPYHDITMLGRLTPRAGEVDKIRFEAQLDVQSWTALGMGDVCQMMLLTGNSCTACPNGSPTCVDVAWEDGAATWDQSLPRLREVTPQSRVAAGCP